MLPHPECSEPEPPFIELVEADQSFFRSLPCGSASDIGQQVSFHYCFLDDGSHYFSWRDIYEFLVPPHDLRIIGRFFDGVPAESFLPYLVAGGLSFCFLKLGLDPIHATAVAVEGGAIGFLGSSGYGKSSLAGEFLAAGHLMLTDDLLVLRKESSKFFAYPGPPHIKLSNELAPIVLHKAAEGAIHNPRTLKLTIPLTTTQCVQAPVPLKALYLLNRPRKLEGTNTIKIHRLSQTQGLLTLIRNCFNDWVTGSSRLKLQLDSYSQIASEVPIKSIVYPRRLDLLSDVRNSILEDLWKLHAEE